MLKYGSIDVDVVLAGERMRRALHDADNLEFVAVDVDPLADRVFAVEQGPRDVGADHGYGHVVLVFDIGEKAAFVHLHLAALGVGFFGAHRGLALYSSLPL